MTKPDADQLRQLGQMVRARRKLLSRSIRDLAAALEITPAYLGIIETGTNPKTKQPSQPALDLIYRIARELALPAAKLAQLAGHEPMTEDAVAETLAQRKLPGIFHDLVEIERDLGSYVDEGDAPQVPVFAVLGYFDRTPEDEHAIRIAGRSFRVGQGRPGKLYALSSRVTARGKKADLFELVRQLERGESLERDVRITVFGELMTPTVLLMAHLRTMGEQYRIVNGDRPEGEFSHPDVLDETKPVVTLDVVYSDDLQIGLLRREPNFDFALAVYPFRRILDSPEVYYEVELDLWKEYRAARLPMNLIVTSGSGPDFDNETHRRAVRDAVDLLATAQTRLSLDAEKLGRYALLPSRRQHADEVEQALAVFPDPYIDVSDQIDGGLAGIAESWGEDFFGLDDELALLTELGVEIGLLRDPRPPEWYKSRLIFKYELIPTLQETLPDLPVLRLQRGARQR